jgi:hypothetical protein
VCALRSLPILRPQTRVSFDAESSVHLHGCGASGYLSRFGRSVSRWTDRDGVSCGRTAFVPTACDGLKNGLPLARRPGVLFCLFTLYTVGLRKAHVTLANRRFVRKLLQL